MVIDDTDDEARAREVGGNPDDAERDSDDMDGAFDEEDEEDVGNERAQVANWDELLEDPDWNMDNDSNEVSEHSGSEFGESESIAAGGPQVVGANGRRGTVDELETGAGSNHRGKQEAQLISGEVRSMSAQMVLLLTKTTMNHRLFSPAFEVRIWKARCIDIAIINSLVCLYKSFFYI